MNTRAKLVELGYDILEKGSEIQIHRQCGTYLGRLCEDEIVDIIYPVSCDPEEIDRLINQAVLKEDLIKVGIKYKEDKQRKKMGLKSLIGTIEESNRSIKNMTEYINKITGSMKVIEK